MHMLLDVVGAYGTIREPRIPAIPCGIHYTHRSRPAERMYQLDFIFSGQPGERLSVSRR